MFEKKLLFIVLILLPVTFGVPYDTNLYSLGSNLVNNSMFLTPDLTNKTMDYYEYGPIDLGWTCNALCELFYIQRRCANRSATCNISFTQGIDVDTQKDRQDNIYQDITITTAGQYYFRVLWMPAITKPIGRNLAIYFNFTKHGTIIVKDSQLIDHVYEVVVNLTAGVMRL